VDLVLASHPGPDASELVRTYVRFGASPRGAQALLLASKVVALLDGRPSVSVEDVRAVAPAALRHRVGLGYEAAVDDIDAERVVDDLLATVEFQPARV
jgi:MoxR-like ATPase